MQIFFIALIMIFIVSLSSVIYQILPFYVPVPLVQIITGALLASLKMVKLHVTFDPDLFFVLFIPPLLFADGSKILPSDFFAQGLEIISLALFLVLFTVISMGYLIYLLIPGISLLPAFALAAVLAPTDAIALSGIVGEGRKMPKKIMFILQGEALMNDAASLVSLKIILSMAFGKLLFEWTRAGADMLLLSIGGLISGITICMIYSRCLRLFSKWSGNDPTTQIILVLLLPFFSYLIAEYIGVSGILSSVASGMTITHSGIIRQAPLTMRLKANGIWQALEFIFNGIIFIMLGLQLPYIFNLTIAKARVDTNLDLWMLVVDIFIVNIGLIFIRFVWLWMMKIISLYILPKNTLSFANYSLNEILITSFSGVRGTITLAGVLSIPIFINNIPFTSRYELIGIATGVIILSIFSCAVILPILLHYNIKNTDKYENKRELQIARSIIAEVAIESLEKMTSRLEKDTEQNIDIELLNEISTRVISDLRSRTTKDHEDIEKVLFTEDLERRFRLTALWAERAEIYHLRATKKISSETMEKLLHEHDLLEELLVITAKE